MFEEKTYRSAGLLLALSGGLAATASAQGLIFQSQNSLSNAGDRLGHALAGIQDVSGNGMADIAAGMPGGFNAPGQVRLLEGNSGNSVGILTGPASSTNFGSSLGWGEDGTLLVGSNVDAFRYPYNPVTNSFGAPITVTPIASNVPIAALSHGFVDFTGDGVSDYALGQSGLGGPGVVEFRNGATDAIHAVVTVVGNGPGGGSSVADIVYLGNVDGLGGPEVGIAHSGGVDIYTMIPSPSGQNQYSINLFRNYLGDTCRVARLGELVPDANTQNPRCGEEYAVTDTVISPSNQQLGRVQIFNGQTGAVVTSRTDFIDNSRYGHMIAYAGDPNLDGRPELLIARSYNGTQPGPANVVLTRFFGPSFNFSTAQNFPSVGVGSDLGSAMFSVGDLDGDGLRDVVIAAPGRLADSGTIYAYGSLAEDEVVGDAFCDCTVAPGCTGPNPVSTSPAGCGNDSGTYARLRMFSPQVTPSVAADTLTGRADGLNSNVLTILMIGTATGNNPIGNGRFCLGGSIRRMVTGLSDTCGSMTYGPGMFAGLPSVITDPWVQGNPVYFQAFYRDSCSGVSAFNYTNAVSLTLAP